MTFTGDCNVCGTFEYDGTNDSETAAEEHLRSDVHRTMLRLDADLPAANDVFRVQDES